MHIKGLTIYNFCEMCVLLITRLLLLVGRLDGYRFNHTSWMDVVTPTDRPKSVHNCCVIDVFVASYKYCPLVVEFSVGIGAFVIGLSQISFFFSSSGCSKCLQLFVHILLCLYVNYFLLNGKFVFFSIANA